MISTPSAVSIRAAAINDDSLIDLLTVNADENLYKITLINHQGLYLTPESKSNNANG